VRFWRDPPATCSASNVANFLEQQGIKDDSIVVEIYLDKFESYMLLEACEADNVKLTFRPPLWRNQAFSTFV
jgi:sulfur carrier protein ThiS